jgi:hypothetical protein
MAPRRVCCAWPMSDEIHKFQMKTLSLDGKDVGLISGVIHARTRLGVGGRGGKGLVDWNGSGLAKMVPRSEVRHLMQVRATTKDQQTLSGVAWVGAADNQFDLQGNGEMLVS